jgi:NAD(P) transhydrogenase
VIGSGPAGEKGAAQAAYFGKRVAIVERAPHLGGAGVNTGTIPSKTLRESALYFSGLAQRGLYGRDYTLRDNLTVQDFLHREQEVVRALREVILRNVERHHIDLIHGEAVLEDPHTVRVLLAVGGERHVAGEVILVATGSVPNRARDIPFEDPRVYDSDTILAMQRLPKTLAIVGAGVIGCEYATMFTALGIHVTLVDGRDKLLTFLDGELSERLRDRMKELGVTMRLGEGLERVEAKREGVTLHMKRGMPVVADAVLFAAGRLGATAGLGLERLGVAVNDRGHIAVNEHYQSAAPNVYAAGDVIGFPALAATSMEQARVAMCHAFDLKYKTHVARMLPMAVYTIPEVAAVGETEESARAQGIDYCVGRSSYSENPRGQICGDLGGQIKLVFRADDRVLLGVHIIGEAASELVHVGLMVMNFGGTIDAFIDAVFNYPTLGDAYKYAAYDGLGSLAKRRASG